MRRFCSVVLSLGLVAGCGEPERRPWFLKTEPVAPASAPGVTEASLRVPIHPRAVVDETQTLRGPDRLCLVCLSSDEPRAVVGFYEQRLRVSATRSRGPTGEHYVLACPEAPAAGGGVERTMVVIEPRWHDGRLVGSIIRLINQRFRPRTKPNRVDSGSRGPRER